jgi:hypothetical protein
VRLDRVLMPLPGVAAAEGTFMTLYNFSPVMASRTTTRRFTVVTPLAAARFLVMTLIAINFQNEAAGKDECADHHYNR